MSALQAMPAAVLTVPQISRSEVERRWRIRELGLWMFLGTVVMLFAAFTSALVVRQSGEDWRTFDLPSILWFNTAVILVSSVPMQAARRAGRHARELAVALIGLSSVLGLVFLAGQLEAWRILVRVGVFLPTNPSSGFFP